MSITEEQIWQKPSGKIKIKLIQKGVNPLISDPDHEAFNLFGTSTRDYLLPIDNAGNLHNPFISDEEQKWLEDSLDLDLNYHKDKDNYWHKAKLALGKADKHLDLSNPKHYIEYVIARANKLYFAPSIKSQKAKATYKYVLVAEEEEVKVNAGKVNKTAEAYKYFGKIEDDKEAMLNFLKVYGKRVSSSSKESFLTQEIGKIIEEDIDGFLEIARDSSSYELKILISEAVEAGAILKNGKKYSLPGGDDLCFEGLVPTLENVVTYLKHNSNQDVLLTLKARVQNAKD